MKVRVGTWNCRQRLDPKMAAVAELACDVLVVPECARSVQLAHDPRTSFAWMGDYAPKGLGVFGFAGWQVEPTPEVDSGRSDHCPVTVDLEFVPLPPRRFRKLLITAAVMRRFANCRALGGLLQSSLSTPVVFISDRICGHRNNANVGRHGSSIPQQW